LTGARDAACAVDALRRGWPVTIGGAITVLAIETADTESLRAFDPEAQADILISAGRAATLKLTNQRNAAAPDAPVRVARTRWLGLSEATALADPALDLATPMKGPFEAIAVTSAEASAAALQLARHAGLLPAFFVTSGRLPDAIAVTPEAINAYEGAARLRIVSRARLPVEAAEQSEIIAFRTPEAGLEHVALMIGSPNGQPPLVRLHSECLTGDVLGSLKCDCGPQLQAALQLMAEQGWGILLYLRQEGRGIGLINKLRAYALQDQGFDTVDANTRLGFAVDARDFSVAAQMLRLLGQDRIRLLTNNPDKVARLQAEGVTVVERVPHKLPPNPHNQRYLETKRDRTGHAL
jgi:GTP cyclohydrolase II